MNVHVSQPSEHTTDLTNLVLLPIGLLCVQSNGVMYCKSSKQRYKHRVEESLNAEEIKVVYVWNMLASFTTPVKSVFVGT